MKKENLETKHKIYGKNSNEMAVANLYDPY